MSDGEMTIDHYSLVNCIATGNYTQVWEVTEQGGAQSFAMKLLLPEARKDQDQVRVIKAEAKAGKLFDHPNLMKVHFSVVNKQHGYIIMDYFRALNLKTQIHNDMTSLHVRIRKLVESTLLGLGYMHERGWVHRDVKPDNILFNKGGELRIVDYSLAARAKRKHKEIQGTKSYIAPETLLKKPVTAQTDMYSFGVTIYLVLTGEFPITGMTPSELLKNHIRVAPFAPSKLNPNITPEMDAFVLRMLAKNPKDRFSTMAEAHAEFRNINVFVEDVEKLQAEQKVADEKLKMFGIDAASRLDSRADAERQALMERDGIAPPKSTAKRPAPKAANAPPAAKAAPAAPPSPAPPQQPPMPDPAMMPQQYPQQPYPQQPGMMPPMAAPQYPMMGQPYGQMPPGGAPLPQFPQFPPGMPQAMPPGMPQAMPPGMPQQPQPGMPQSMPGAPAPQQGAPQQHAPQQGAPQPAPAAQPQPAPAAQPQPAAQPAAAQAPKPAPAPAPKPTAPAVAPGEDLDFMDELPDVI